MYLNHQLFANFPFIDVKYLSVSTERKAFVSTSPPRDEHLPVFAVCEHVGLYKACNIVIVVTGEPFVMLHWQMKKEFCFQ